MKPVHSDGTYRLEDRYSRTSGRVFLTGTQALVRIMLDQARRDRMAGLNTAGFVSGYRGSPLGAVDLEMWRADARLRAAGITFMPAVNEDLAATAVLGAQQASLAPGCAVEGVFSMWYGKGPGVDRSGDALRHGNAYGTSARGGVLVVAGDDHGCVSSSMPHQSDVAFMAWFMPTLNPASVAEFPAFGEYGFALSRFSGTWVGFKAVSEVVEGAASFELAPFRRFVLSEIEVPPGGLHVRAADLPSPEIETRIRHKLRAVRAFAEANPIDRPIYDIPGAVYGIVTTGKAHLDLMEALRLLGLDESACRRLGIDIYKVGMVWPLARRAALRFVSGKHEVLVVEEKRGIIESQFKEYFYDWPGDKPRRMVGKYDSRAQPLIPWTGELDPLMLAPLVAARLERFFPEERLVERARALCRTPARPVAVPGATRRPYFCSGCPHNTSTRVPEGSTAASGIGCHVMASWMGRNTVGYAQMGGEGVPHVAASLFTGAPHMFQNLGEGTWYHSGSLAIRQAVAAGANITYKILYNDAVAMTGGQPVDGPISVQGIAQTCRAEGVERIALVSDDIGAFRRADFPAGTTFHDRAEMDALQRELRQVVGVSVLIYAQACATEKRRRRKRGQVREPARFAYINATVCEGCGDCSVQSNCLSVEPLDTPFGRKRRINQSSCNGDFTCLDGFCPAFVTVEGGARRRPRAALERGALVAGLPRPRSALPPQRPFDLLITGVGGTGVVTLGALVGMAAHLDGLGVSVLDFTGFAQKFGTVLSHVRLARAPDALNQMRIASASADAVIGCDVVVSSSEVASRHYRAGTRMALNLAQMPTGDLVLERDATLDVARRRAEIARALGPENLDAFDAHRLAERFLGDTVFGNIVLLGHAWQRALVPVSLRALERAIELNGVAVEDNLLALAIGRCHAGAPARLDEPAGGPQAAAAQAQAGAQAGAPVGAAQAQAGAQGAATDRAAEDGAVPLDELVARHVAYLGEYQNAAYGARYQRRVAALRAALPFASGEMLRTAATNLFRFMAAKDEYEVARLLSAPEFGAELAAAFSGPFALRYHLAPPGLSRTAAGRDRPSKHAFGRAMGLALPVLARLRFLRRTPFNPFAWHAEARLHRATLRWYEDLLERAGAQCDERTESDWHAILALGDGIRGFGPVRKQAAARAVARARTLLAALDAEG